MSRTVASMLVLLGCMGAASAPPPNAHIKVAPPAVLAINGVIERATWTHDQIERWVFQPCGNVSAAHQELESQLTRQILDMDRTFSLTKAQKRKLELAGRGDIKRYFDRYEAVKHELRSMNKDEVANAVSQDVFPLQMALQLGLFHEDSLMVKSLPNTLTSEQFARYDAMARERRATRHRQSVARAIARLEEHIILRDAQRRELFALIARETKPSRRSGPYDDFVLLLQLDRLPREKLKRLFDETQWEDVIAQLAQCHQLEPMLKQVGQWPIEEDGADSTAR